MTLRVLSFRAMVRMQAQAMQGASARVLNFSVGSTARAWIEASAGIGLWVQWQVLEVLKRTRAATSRGRHLDSWMADYSLARLPAVAATGQVVLSRTAAGQASFVPEGAAVKTADGAKLFVVMADAAHAAWDAAARGYAVAPATLAITVPVQSAAPGAAGNVAAGTISLLTTPLAGLDVATNPAGFANGTDAESDAALRERFRDYLASLSKATAGAIAFAVRSVQQGLTLALAENMDTAGQYRPGHFVVTVDDGTGTPSADLIERVQAAVDEVRGFTITFAVRPPVVLPATISMVLTMAPGADKQVAIGRVGTAVTAYVQGLPIGTALSYGRLFAVAYDADPGITGVGSLMLNGGAANLGGGPSDVVRLASLAVS